MSTTTEQPATSGPAESTPDAAAAPPAQSDSEAAQTPGVEPAQAQGGADATQEPQRDPWEERMDRLAREAAAVRAEKQALKREREKLAEYEQLRELAAKDRRAALAKLGISEDDLLVDMVRGTPEGDAAMAADPKRLADRIAHLEQEIAEERKAREERERAKETDARYAEWRTARIAEARGLADRYPYAAAVGSLEDVPAIIEEVWMRTQELITVEEAARYADKKARDLAARIKPLLAPAQSAPQRGRSGPRTLTGLSGAPSTVDDAFAPGMTKDEAIRRAVELVTSGKSPYLTADALDMDA